jgi:hypothetical protein
MTPTTAAALRDLARVEPLTLRIAGACMEPALGDAARPRVVAAERIWPGDVVAMLAPGGETLLAHRVLARIGDRVFTQADTAGAPDGVATISVVVGRLDVPVTVAARARSVLRFARLVLGRLRSRLA